MASFHQFYNCHHRSGAVGFALGALITAYHVQQKLTMNMIICNFDVQISYCVLRFLGGHIRAGSPHLMPDTKYNYFSLHNMLHAIVLDDLLHVNR